MHLFIFPSWDFKKERGEKKRGEKSQYTKSPKEIQ